MNHPSSFNPKLIWNSDLPTSTPSPRVWVSPHRYIQGQGVLDQIGKYLSILPAKNPVILISPGGQKRFGEKITLGLKKFAMMPQFVNFESECSYQEVARLASLIKKGFSQSDVLIAVGGGKCLDAGKCVAYRLGVPVVICPTIASTDAPCSASSVMYSEQGVQVGAESFPGNPSLVVVDTEIILKAPIRQLVAGMGDALATFYEARTCFQNPKAHSMIGTRLTIAALAISELCASTIYKHGAEAVQAARDNQVNEAFEQVVEANTLLSGIGFESGGLSTAHAVAAGLTMIPVLHDDFFHGELVGIGLLVHLQLEGKELEAQKVGEFLARIGLPVHCGQLSLDINKDAISLQKAMEGAIKSGLADTEPFAVNSQSLWNAFKQAHQLGIYMAEEIGMQAYLELHSL